MVVVDVISRNGNLSNFFEPVNSFYGKVFHNHTDTVRKQRDSRSSGALPNQPPND